MKSIVAIGGGDTFEENKVIHQHMIKLSKKRHPNLLFIPTASGDPILYFDKFYNHFTGLGCNCDALYLIHDKPSFKAIQDRINWADIIYVGGCNTLKMMVLWRRLKVDQLLKKAYHEGTIMSGLSAGSICWFKYGNSDSRRFKNPKADLIKVSGLNLVDALHCPHYDAEKDRKPDLKKMMQKMSGYVAVALDNNCAVEISDGQYRLISSRSTSNAYKVYWKNRAYYEEVIKKSTYYQDLNQLIKIIGTKQR